MLFLFTVKPNSHNRNAARIRKKAPRDVSCFSIGCKSAFRLCQMSAWLDADDPAFWRTSRAQLTQIRNSVPSLCHSTNYKAISNSFELNFQRNKWLHRTDIYDYRILLSFKIEVGMRSALVSFTTPWNRQAMIIVRESFHSLSVLLKISPYTHMMRAVLWHAPLVSLNIEGISLPRMLPCVVKQSCYSCVSDGPLSILFYI